MDKTGPGVDLVGIFWTLRGVSLANGFCLVGKCWVNSWGLKFWELWHYLFWEYQTALSVVHGFSMYVQQTMERICTCAMQKSTKKTWNCSQDSILLLNTWDKSWKKTQNTRCFKQTLYMNPTPPPETNLSMSQKFQKLGTAFFIRNKLRLETFNKTSQVGRCEDVWNSWKSKTIKIIDPQFPTKTIVLIVFGEHLFFF